LSGAFSLRQIRFVPLNIGYPPRAFQSCFCENLGLAAELSYRYYVGTQVGDKWLCVVVKYAMNDAFVVTAYLTDKPKKGKRIWPKE